MVLVNYKLYYKLLLRNRILSVRAPERFMRAQPISDRIICSIVLGVDNAETLL